jgi:hypothetical protein
LYYHAIAVSRSVFSKVACINDEYLVLLNITISVPKLLSSLTF